MNLLAILVLFAFTSKVYFDLISKRHFSASADYLFKRINIGNEILFLQIGKLTITPFSAVFLFRPKFWSILDWLFSRFKLPFLTIGKTRCAARSRKRAIWLPGGENTSKVINLNSWRIEYLRTKADGVPNIPRNLWGLVTVKCAENCREVTLHRSEGWLRTIWSQTSEQQSSGSEQ